MTASDRVRRGLRRTVQQTVKCAAAGFDKLRPPARGLVVLEYHRIGGGTELELDVAPSVFAEQMAWLGESGRAVTLDDGLGQLGTSFPPNSDPVVVTFDDGTADFMDHALPVLVDHQVPATYYIATEFVEQQRPFDHDGVPLSWAALAEMISTGLVTVGSHTHSHAVLDKVDAATAASELDRAAGLIEDRLGVPADHFAYPKGVLGSSEVEQLIRSRHRSAAIVHAGQNPYGSTNPFRLERSPVQRSDGFGFFRNKLDGGMRLEGQLRTRMNSRRYRDRQN